MTRSIPIFLSPAALVLASCSAAQTGDNAAASSTPSPTMAAANGQAVAGTPVELQSTSPFAAASHATLDEPWAIAVHPEDGRLFITEQAGTMKVYDPATGRTSPVTGLPQVAYGGQGGLGDFVFGPDFAQSRMVYLSWAEAAGNETYRAVAGRGRLACNGDDCRIENLEPIWRQSEAVTGQGHYSHRIAFSPDGQHLYISSGDRQKQDPAQDLSNNLGTVVRLGLDGTPAPGNPFADRSAPTDQIWTYGQRNILGLAFDPQGELWGLEHGPAGGDELNLLKTGNNYGWPVRSNGDNYNGTTIPDHSADDGFVKPVIGWTPVIAPGDFLFYTGAMWPEWQGDALIANLRSTSISRVDIAADDASANEAARYAFPERLRDIAQAPDGALWVIEDGENGRLLRLTPKRGG